LIIGRSICCRWSGLSLHLDLAERGAGFAWLSRLAILLEPVPSARSKGGAGGGIYGSRCLSGPGDGRRSGGTGFNLRSTRVSRSSSASLLLAA